MNVELSPEPTRHANGRTVFENALLVDGRLVSFATESGFIVAVDDGAARNPAAMVVDLEGALVLPSLIDGHIHLDKTFLGHGWRSHRPCTAGFNVRERVAFEKEELAQAGDVVRRASALVEHVVARGTGHLRCHVDIDPDVGLSNLEAVNEVRERYADCIEIEVVAFPQSGIVSAPGTADLLESALRNGADLIGGLDPASFDRDIEGHLGTVFSLAERHGVGIDIHLHDGDLLGVYEIEEICGRTVAAGMQGCVAISHAYSLGQIAVPVLMRVADNLARAGVAIMTNAPGNHGFPPVRALHDAGVTVFAGSDNIRDAWWPYGDGDMLERAMIIGYRSGFLVDEDLKLAFAMTGNHAARVLRLERYGIDLGSPADFVTVAAKAVPEAVVARPVRERVYKGGRLVARGGTFLNPRHA